MHKVMKPASAWLALMLSLGCVLGGCQLPKARSTGAGSAAPSIRNDCCSLLHQLLQDEKHIGLLRFIKREQADVKELVKRIGAASGAGAKLIEELARKDPSLQLKKDLLPPGEILTRDAIAATMQKELLAQTGATFELTLLITQLQALSYGRHLAKVAAENEPQPDRALALASISQDMENLYQEVFALLLAKIR